MKAAKAVVAAAEAIRNLDGVERKDETNAIREQFETLSFLSRYDRKSRNQMTALVKQLKNDERPEIAQIVAVESFKLRIDSASKATAEQQMQMIQELKALLADREFDRDAYGLASSLARAIGYSDSSEVAASLYEDMSAMMSDKDGERGWDNPLATHYGISGIPTAILVDQEGKVVSLRARGKELDRLLAEMLGELEPTKADETSEGEADRKVAEK